jgi:hypothetical protein
LQHDSEPKEKKMNSVTIIRVAAGFLAFVVLLVIIARRRRKAVED